METGTIINQYKIISAIGKGGMGEVYKAHDSRLDREVAIKILPPEFAGEKDRLLRFEQEAKATSSLNHPNILTVYDIGEHDGSPYIVAELLDGEELRQRLDEGPIPLRKLTEYAQQIVSVNGGPEKVIGSLGLEYLPVSGLNPGVRLSLTPDGKSITYGIRKSTSNLWLMDGLDTVPRP